MKTIFIGNGLNRLESDLSWENLLEKQEELKDIPNTLFFETRVCDGESEIGLKNRVAEKLKKLKCKKEVYRKLASISADHIITTNYDDNILAVFDNYKWLDKTETLYSFHRIIEGEINNKTVLLWKVHGDYLSPKSIMLGVDHYSRSMNRIGELFKEKYRDDNYLNDLLKRKERPSNWIDLFFCSDVFFLGFGLDYSEIDIWWVLTKRARMKQMSMTKMPINNRIVYYDTYISKEKKTLLERLKVEVVSYNKKQLGEKECMRKAYDYFISLIATDNI